MQRYILKRLLQGVICLFAVTLIIFALTRLSGDPLVLLMPDEASAEEYDQMRKALGLNKSLPEQYARYLINAFRGDFGESIRWQEPALDLVLSRFPATIQLTLAAMLISICISLPIGILSAVKRDSALDTIGKVFALMGQSMPIFWVGILLMLLFAVIIPIFPTSGREGIQYYVLPAVTLGWAVNAALMRLSRSSMLDVLDSEYIKMARIKGVQERYVIWKHALKNAAIPVVTMIGMQFAGLLRGAVVTETVFAWPGVGRLTIEAIYARDFPVVQAAVLIMAAIFVFMNLVVDILYAYLDPRIRY